MKNFPLSKEEHDELAELDANHSHIHYVHIIPNSELNFSDKAGATIAWYRKYPHSRLIYFTIASLNPNDVFIKKRGRLHALRKIKNNEVLTVSVSEYNRGTKDINKKMKMFFNSLVLDL